MSVYNNVGAKDTKGNKSPWIEFRNVSNTETDFSDYTLTVNTESGIKLPAIKIAPGEYAIVFASGINSGNSINAKLKSTGLITLMLGDAQFAGSSSVPAHVEMKGLIGAPMVGMTVAVEEACK